MIFAFQNTHLDLNKKKPFLFGSSYFAGLTLPVNKSEKMLVQIAKAALIDDSSLRRFNFGGGKCLVEPPAWFGNKCKKKKLLDQNILFEPTDLL